MANFSFNLSTKKKEKNYYAALVTPKWEGNESGLLLVPITSSLSLLLSLVPVAYFLRN